MEFYKRTFGYWIYKRIIRNWIFDVTKTVIKNFKIIKSRRARKNEVIAMKTDISYVCAVLETEAEFYKKNHDEAAKKKTKILRL